MYQSWKYVGNLLPSSGFVTKPVRDLDEYFHKQIKKKEKKNRIKNSPRLSSAFSLDIFSRNLSSTCTLRDVIAQDDTPGGLDTPDFNKSNQMRMLLILNPTNFGFFHYCIE